MTCKSSHIYVRAEKVHRIKYVELKTSLNQNEHKAQLELTNQLQNPFSLWAELGTIKNAYVHKKNKKQ